MMPGNSLRGPHEGRIALVTGAAKGIGAATAKAFADAGAVVVLCDIDEANLETTRASLPGRDHLAIRLDVTVEADWIRAVDQVDSAFGRLDILVNNAGWGNQKSLFETSFDEWRTIIAINLDSVFLGTVKAMPLLERSGSGAIVNVSSMRAMVVTPGSSPYSAAKAGSHVFSKATAVECAAAGKNVRCNSVHPGWVDTALSRQAPEALRAERRKMVPQGRYATPEEIAAGILFLSSEAASYVNGTELVIDGGFTAT